MEISPTHPGAGGRWRHRSRRREPTPRAPEGQQASGGVPGHAWRPGRDWHWREPAGWIKPGTVAMLKGELEIHHPPPTRACCVAPARVLVDTGSLTIVARNDKI